MPYYQLKNHQYLTETLKKLEAAIYRPVLELKVEAWVTPEPVAFIERQSGKYKALAITTQTRNKRFNRQMEIALHDRDHRK